MSFFVTGDRCYLLHLIENFKIKVCPLLNHITRLLNQHQRWPQFVLMSTCREQCTGVECTMVVKRSPGWYLSLQLCGAPLRFTIHPAPMEDIRGADTEPVWRRLKWSVTLSMSIEECQRYFRKFRSHCHMLFISGVEAVSWRCSFPAVSITHREVTWTDFTISSSLFPWDS